jgi:xanthine/CO dehydrogenase XdhC/CoxF family maturation factor
VGVIELDIVSREAALLRARGAPFFLATVVRVEGSSYRRPGARMLIADDRWVTGCVSGGCIEGDVMRRVEFRTRSGPVVARYDSTSEDDYIGWGFGVGCNGIVDVLLERIDETTPCDPMLFVEACIGDEERGVLITVFESSNETVPVGARICLRGGNVVSATVPAGPARNSLTSGALASLASMSGWTHAHELQEDGICALVEPIVPVPHVFLVGSGQDVVPVVRLVLAMGFRVTVADAHGSIAMYERFADAHRVLVCAPHELARAVDEHDTALAVIMTHDYERDRSYLTALLGTAARYVGVLGPERRTARMVAELLDESSPAMEITEEALSRLHAPVGLELGAETPSEIALSIVAEIQATLTNTSGRRLRERRGSIHAPSSGETSVPEAETVLT